MKCPRSNSLVTDKPGELEFAFRDCLQEYCGWWDHNGGRCAVLEISRSLNAIGNTLGQLTDKLRPELFRNQ